MILRLINTWARDGFYNMALDEALFRKAQSNNLCTAGYDSTLRFYTFSPPAITIGYSQSIRDIKNLKKYGFPIIRRITGGRAVVHNGDLTYSLVTNETNPTFGGSVFESYKKVSLIFALGLKTLNIDACLAGSVPLRLSERSRQTQIVRTTNHYERIPVCFSSFMRYELQVNGKKILGSAQRRANGTILQQGTIPISPPNFVSYPSVDGRSTSCLSEILGRDFKLKEITIALKQGIKASGIKIIEGTFTNEERELTDKLLKKYSTKEWNFFKKRLDIF
ncbi:lipoate--protein ligase family protein [candidate division WOR-3 bacterium]|nr:lipoate--protein ligase family protein [candidate division WOR-3 bacterium]